MSQPRTPIAIAVVECRGRYLAGPRPPGRPLAGFWEFPGGHVSEGETAAEAAVRECREETGLEVEVLGEYDEQVECYEHGSLQLRFFACRPREDACTPKEPFRWMSRAELAGCRFPSGNQPLLRRLLGA